MLRIRKTMAGVLSILILGVSLSACSASKVEEPEQKVEVKPAAKATQSQNDSEEKESFKPNDQLSPQQNAIVKEIMEQNGYSQKTAEGILTVTDSVCNLLDEKAPESIENQKTLKAIYDAPQDQSEAELKKWFINLKVATANICPEKQDIVLRYPPESLR